MLPDSELSQINLFLNHLGVLDQEKILAGHRPHLPRKTTQRDQGWSLMFFFSRLPHFFNSIPSLLELMDTSSRILSPHLYACPIPYSDLPHSNQGDSFKTHINTSATYVKPFKSFLYILHLPNPTLFDVYFGNRPTSPFSIS